MCYGCDVKRVLDDDGVSHYVSKIHFELARPDLKIKDDGTSRTPWQVAVDGVRDGVKVDIARWAEFATATKGKKIYSRSQALDRPVRDRGTEDQRRRRPRSRNPGHGRRMRHRC